MRRRGGVDWVALTLAVALALVAVLIMSATIINVIDQRAPTATLGAPTAQILNTLIGGIVGILGGSVGYSLNRQHGPGEDKGGD